MLGAHSDLDGNFKFSGDTIINCNVKGTIHMLNNASLTLERESRFEGELYAHDIEIFGEFSGSINASGKVVVKSSGSISGQVTSNQLVISPGAVVNIEGQTKSYK